MPDETPPPTLEAQIASLLARVTALETPRPLPPQQPQQPSKCRGVIYRDATGNEYAATVTAVRTTGVDLVVFGNDRAPFNVMNQPQILDPTQAGEVGWFWPPRT